MYQQFWGYKVEEKLYLGVREQKRLNTTALDCAGYRVVTAEFWTEVQVTHVNTMKNYQTLRDMLVTIVECVLQHTVYTTVKPTSLVGL
jgi:hypothetical protein